MYGLIFENFSAYLKHKYGEEAWDQIRRLANLDSPTFSIHQAILLFRKLASCLPQLFTVHIYRSTQSSYSAELPKRPSLSWAVMRMSFLRAWAASS